MGSAIQRLMADSMPAGAVDADLDLPWKASLAHLPIKGRAGKPGTGQNGLETNDPLDVGHGLHFHTRGY